MSLSSWKTQAKLCPLKSLRLLSSFSSRPLIILRKPDWQVLGVAIANLFTDQRVEWELVFAGSLVSTLPVLIIFIFLQRYYVAGMLSGSVKE